MTIAETMGFDRQRFLDIAPDISAVIKEAELAFDRGEDVGFRVERSKDILLPNGFLEIRQLSDVFRTMGNEMVIGPSQIPTTAETLTNKWFDDKFSDDNFGQDLLFYKFTSGEAEHKGGDFRLGKNTEPKPFFDPRDGTTYDADAPDLAERQEDLLSWFRQQLADDSEVSTTMWFSQLGRKIGGSYLLPLLSDVTRTEILRRADDETEEPSEFYTIMLRRPGTDNKFTHIGIDPVRGEAYQQVDIDDDPPGHVVPKSDLLQYVAKLIKQSSSQ